MAKIGTAHVEIKPVVNVEALEDLSRLIEEAVARGVKRGIESATTTRLNFTVGEANR
jgi:hypothetical protein